MIKPIFKTLINRKIAKIVLAFSAFPLLLIVVGLFNTGFMQMSAPKGSMSFLDFFGAVIKVQFNSALPSIAFMYLIVVFVNDEISNGLMYLFKDLNKTKILNAKLVSVILLYGIYFFLTLLASLVTYYLYLIRMPYTSGKFLSTTDGTQSAIISIIGVILFSILLILVTFALSITLKNGATLILGTIFYLVGTMSEHLSELKYFFPNGYDETYQAIGFSKTIFIILGIFLIYAVIFYSYSNFKFKRIEY